MFRCFDDVRRYVNLCWTECKTLTSGFSALSLISTFNKLLDRSSENDFLLLMFDGVFLQAGQLSAVDNIYDDMQHHDANSDEQDPRQSSDRRELVSFSKIHSAEPIWHSDVLTVFRPALKLLIQSVRQRDWATTVLQLRAPCGRDDADSCFTLYCNYSP